MDDHGEHHASPKLPSVSICVPEKIAHAAELQQALHGATRRMKVFAVLLAVAVAAHLSLLCARHRSDANNINTTTMNSNNINSNNKRNVIFMVSDGFGPTSEVFARDFYQHLMYGTGQLPPVDDPAVPKQLPLDTILVGTSRTRSYNSWVTDSAAGATAFSCALKSYNGAIGVNATGMPCATLMEVAKAQGYKTALVVRSKITDATPASFSAHATYRWYEREIATQQIGHAPFGRTIDLMMGGGRCEFLANVTDDSCRKDNRDLENEARQRGFNNVFSTRAAFDALPPTKHALPVLGLLANKHMSYEIDRDPSTEPSLKEMVEKALQIMTDATADSEHGFMMLVEGSRIDMAAHANDAAAHAHEILAYQQTIALVKDYVEQHPGTVMISTSDHETGGLALGRQLTTDYPVYAWFPEVVARVRNSTYTLAKTILNAPKRDRKLLIEQVVLPVLMGIEDFRMEDVDYLASSNRNDMDIMNYLGEMVNRRALLSWSSHGHTAVDVNLYAYAGRHQKSLLQPISRNVENTEIGSFMAKLMGLDERKELEMTMQLIAAVQAGRLIMHPPDMPPVPDSSLMTQLADSHDYGDGIH